MARPALATVEDLNEALDPADQVDEDHAAQAGSLLARASEIVRAHAGVTWLTDDESALDAVPAQIPGVVVSMVERATSNPSGAVQEQAGPFSRSFGTSAADRLYLTRWEKLVVSRAAGRQAGLATIGTTRGPLETCAADGMWPDEVEVAWPS